MTGVDDPRLHYGHMDTCRNDGTKMPDFNVLHNWNKPVWRNGRAWDSGSRGSVFETRLSQLVFLIGKETGSAFAALLGDPVRWECPLG